MDSFSIEQQVMFYDTDCGGVVHNLAYLRWVEECRTKYASTVDGMDFALMLEEKRCFVVVRHEVDYLYPATLKDTILITARKCEARASALWFDFEIRRKSDDKLLVKVKQQLALVNTASGRPCRIPEKFRRNLSDET